MRCAHTDLTRHTLYVGLITLLGSPRDSTPARQAALGERARKPLGGVEGLPGGYIRKGRGRLQAFSSLGASSSIGN